MSDLDQKTVEELLRRFAQPRDNSINGLAKRAGVSRQLIYDEMNAGHLPYAQIKGRRLIFEEHEAEFYGEVEDPDDTLERSK